MLSRNAFRINLPSFYKTPNDGTHDLDDHHVFEIRPPRIKKRGLAKFDIHFDDTGLSYITMPVPDTLTDDESLSQGEWILACANLFAESPHCIYNVADTAIFLNDIATYVKELEQL